MAEWLRRLTRNQMGSSRVGSNPTRSDNILLLSLICRYYILMMKIRVEPAKLFFPVLEAAMAEWLRRLTRNQMGSSRVGSNPTRSVNLIGGFCQNSSTHNKINGILFFHHKAIYTLKYTCMHSRN